MLINFSADKTVTDAAAVLQNAPQLNRFGMMLVHNLKETTIKKGGGFGLGYAILWCGQQGEMDRIVAEQMHNHTALMRSSGSKMVLRSHHAT